MFEMSYNKFINNVSNEIQTKFGKQANIQIEKIPTSSSKGKFANKS